MLNAIKGYMKDRQDRQNMLGMRTAMASIHIVLFPQDPTTGVLARMKTGLQLRRLLENRLGLMGPDFEEPIDSDWDLEREAKILDALSPEQHLQLAAHFHHLAERTFLEKGDPSEWEDSGVATKNVAYVVAHRLLSGWFLSKSIVHSSRNREVIKEAQALENLHYDHIRSLLRINRGEPAIKEGEQ
jgi:hypothetical protein